jgi:hypothetical protein
MAWNITNYWRKKTIIEHLNTHLAGMTHDEKVAALKSIVKEVCSGVNVSKNPPKGLKKTRKPENT